METENKQGIFEFHFESENTIEIEFCFNPLSPNINMHVLLTALHIFLIVLVGRILLKDEDILSLVIIFFILMTYMFDQVIIL